MAPSCLSTAGFALRSVRLNRQFYKLGSFACNQHRHRLLNSYYSTSSAPGSQPQSQKIELEQKEAESNASAKSSVIIDYFNSVTRWYESLIGLDEVRQAQQAVLTAEERFLDSQQARRTLQQQQQALSMERERLELEMDKYQKGEDKYLQLILREHDLIKSEQTLLQRVQAAEHEERKKFAQLSAAFRASHEQERAHSDRTKYWTLIGSVAGTLLGVGAASLHRWLRLREAKENQQLAEALKGQANQLNDLLASLATVNDANNSSTTISSSSIDDDKLEQLVDNSMKRAAVAAAGASLATCVLFFLSVKLFSYFS